MRTKTLVLTALIGLGSVAASVAQVYSLNAVGYVNSTCPPGFSILANPLDTTNNTVASLIPTAPWGTTVWTFNGGFSSTTYGYLNEDTGDPIYAWDTPALSLAPGAGFWIKNTASTNFGITWVGTVLTGGLTNNVAVGWNLLGSKVPQSAALDSVLGYSPTFGDSILFFRSGFYTYEFGYYNEDTGDPVNDWTASGVPVPGVGEGFWLKAASAKQWTRTFSIN